MPTELTSDMSEYSLSCRKERIFPEALEVSGEAFPINADFRNILKILRMLDDAEILETHKAGLLCKWFYKDNFPKDSANCFIEFLRADTVEELSEAVESEKQFDFEFDAEEIYVSFLREYGVDLFDVDFLHFFKFRAMLNGLSEKSPFKQKIHLRFKDLSGFKGKQLYLLEKAKNIVKLPEKMTRQERLEADLFDEMWRQQ